MDFKKQLRRDIKAVFHNPKEFAEIANVRYNNKKFNIPIVIDYEGEKDRRRLSSDNADGLFIAGLTVYMPFSDIKILPNKNDSIFINGDKYNILKSRLDEGEIVLDLEALDE